MEEVERNRAHAKYWTGEKEGQAMSRHREETQGDSWRGEGRGEHKQRGSEYAEGKKHNDNTKSGR